MSTAMPQRIIHARTLSFEVAGHPATQGSKKGFLRGKKIVMVEMDEKLPGWRAAVTAAAKRAAGPGWQAIDGAVTVGLDVYLPRPKTTKFGGSPAGPPDTDKLQRAVGDALTKAGVITDDARITRWEAEKHWATTTPGATITIYEKEKP